MKLMWTTFAILLILLLVFGLYKMFQRAALSQHIKPELGVYEGQLVTCPDSPNCVSSFATDARHSIEAITGDLEGFNALVSYIAESDRANIEVRANDYLWVTYKSSFFGFVDDLELYFDGAQIQVRSASREGYSDLGANRTRVETLRTYLESH